MAFTVQFCRAIAKSERKGQPLGPHDEALVYTGRNIAFDGVDVLADKTRGLHEALTDRRLSKAYEGVDIRFFRAAHCIEQEKPRQGIVTRPDCLSRRKERLQRAVCQRNRARTTNPGEPNETDRVGSNATSSETWRLSSIS